MAKFSDLPNEILHMIIEETVPELDYGASDADLDDWLIQRSVDHRHREIAWGALIRRYQMKVTLKAIPVQVDRETREYKYSHFGAGLSTREMRTGIRNLAVKVVVDTPEHIDAACRSLRKLLSKFKSVRDLHILVESDIRDVSIIFTTAIEGWIMPTAKEDASFSMAHHPLAGLTTCPPGNLSRGRTGK